MVCAKHLIGQLRVRAMLYAIVQYYNRRFLIKFNHIVALTNKLQIVLCFPISVLFVYFSKFEFFLLSSKLIFSLCFEPSFKLLN